MFATIGSLYDKHHRGFNKFFGMMAALAACLVLKLIFDQFITESTSGDLESGDEVIKTNTKKPLSVNFYAANIITFCFYFFYCLKSEYGFWDDLQIIGVSLTFVYVAIYHVLSIIIPIVPM